MLLVCATALELNALPEQVLDNPGISVLVCGVGPVESTLNLTRYIAAQIGSEVSAVVNFGVGGAYPDSGLGLLDCCFADSEVLGDLSICTQEDFMDLPDSLAPLRYFTLENGLYGAAQEFCRHKSYPFSHGPFVTVCCASGSEQRGRTLKNKFEAVCENMEGAALARVCQDFNLPFLEVRSISNMVENRNRDRWKLQPAAAKAAALAGEFALFLQMDKRFDS